MDNAATCKREGCPGGEGKWIPVVMFRHWSMPELPVPIEIDLPTCAACKQRTALEDVIDWPRIDTLFRQMARALPTRNLTALTWIEGHSAEWKAAKQAEN